MAGPELRGKVSLDGSSAERTLNKVAAHGKKFALDFKQQLAGVFTIAAVQQMGRALMDHVSRIKDLSEQYQVTTKEVQQFDIAMAKTGMRFEDFGAGLIKFAELRRKAGEGDAESQNFLARFQIFNEDIQDPMKRNLDLALQFMDALQKLPVTAQQAALSEAFGVRSGSKMVEALREFQKLRERNDDSLLINQKDLDDLDAANKKLELLMVRAKALAATNAARVTQNPFRMLGNIFNSTLGLPLTMWRNRWWRNRDADSAAGSSPGSAMPEAFGGMGNLFQDKEGKKILEEHAELMDKIGKIGRGLLSNTERREMLEREINKHLKNAQIMADATDTEGRQIGLKEKEKAVDLLGELAGVQTGRVSINANELQRIGGFAGNATDDTPRTTRSILNEVKKVVKNTEPKLGAEPF